MKNFIDECYKVPKGNLRKGFKGDFMKYLKEDICNNLMEVYVPRKKEY